MEQMPLAILIFYSIPESIVLISIGIALTGSDVQKYIKRIFILSVCLALITYFARLFPAGLNVVVQLPAFILLTIYFLQVNWKRALLIILTGLAVAVFAESIWSVGVTRLSGQKIEFFFHSGVLIRLSYQLPYLALLALLTIFIVRRKISFRTSVDIFKTASVDKKINYLSAVVLCQAFLTGFLYLLKAFQHIWKMPFSIDVLEKITAVSLMTIPVVSVLILKRLFKLSEQETTIRAQEAFIENIRSLFVTVKGQRHDVINHLQVIYTFLQLEKTKDATEYVANLVGEVKEINETMMTQDPALNALVSAKQVVAEGLNVSFHFSTETDVLGIKIKSFDLIKILGNLLDNAIDAVKDLSPDHREINFRIKKSANGIVFEVSNPAPVIPSGDLAKIFESGFSTKKDGEHCGLGLAIVKQLTEKYRGMIGVHSSEGTGTIFSVELPV